MCWPSTSASVRMIDLAVADAADVLGVADVDADGGDEAGDLLVADELLGAGLFDVEHLAAQRQDGLEVAVAAALGRAAGRLSLDEEQLRFVAVAGGAVHELAGQPAAGERCSCGP